MNNSKSFTITGSTAGAQTNYRMQMIINRGAGTDTVNECFLNDLALNWPNDIEFRASDNTTVLDYWVEINSGNRMLVWVEFDSIPASPDTATFYLHYGDATAASLSNIVNTFLWGDDLEDDTVGNDPSNWTVSQGTNSLIKVNDDLLYRELAQTISVDFSATWYVSDGTIWAGHTTDGTVRVSTDEGLTWTTMYTFAVGSSRVRCVWVAANGYIYASRANSQILVRSTDGGTSWGTCLTLSDATSVVWHMDEDSSGNLYVAEYSNGDGTEQCAFIYKSTTNGDSWTTVWNNPDSARHMHFIKVDPYTGYIYASQDHFTLGSGRKIIRSIDSGASWTAIASGSSAWMPTSILFGDGYRLFGQDAPTGGVAVKKTVDDSVFTDVYTPAASDDHAFWNSPYEIRSDGLILFGSWTLTNNERATVVASMDDGVTWTIIEEMATGTGNRGFLSLGNFDPYDNTIITRSITTDCKKVYYENVVQNMRGDSQDLTQADAYRSVTFPSVFVARSEFTAGQTDEVLGGLFVRQDATDRVSVAAWNDRLFYYHNGVAWTSSAVNYLIDKIFYFECIVNLTDGNYDLYINDTLIASDIPFRNAGNTANRVRFGSGANGQGYNYLDNVTVRQYADPEPTLGGWADIVNPTTTSIIKNREEIMATKCYPISDVWLTTQREDAPAYCDIIEIRNDPAGRVPQPTNSLHQPTNYPSSAYLDWVMIHDPNVLLRMDGMPASREEHIKTAQFIDMGIHVGDIDNGNNIRGILKEINHITTGEFFGGISYGITYVRIYRTGTQVEKLWFLGV